MAKNKNKKHSKEWTRKKDMWIEEVNQKVKG